MTITPGRCAVPRCGVEIKPAFLMCRSCWAAVPLFIRRRVYAAFDQYKRGEAGLAQLRNVQARAVEAVARGGAV